MDRLPVLALVLASLLILPVASAHEPRLVAGQNIHSENDSLLIENPQISQAFYGSLTGQPDFYRITLDNRTPIYVSIAAPFTPDAKTDFTVEVYDHKDTAITQVIILNGPGSNWTPFYEPFGGDWYLQGPSDTENLTNVTYYIKVSSPSNQGKYALIIGQEESFPPDEAINAFFLLPVIKQDFFGQPVAFAFVAILGLMLAMGSFFAGAAIVLTSNKVRMKSAAYAYSKLEYMIWSGMLLIFATLIYLLAANPMSLLGILGMGIFILLVLFMAYSNRKASNLESTVPWSAKIGIGISILLWLAFLLVTAALI